METIGIFYLGEQMSIYAAVAERFGLSEGDTIDGPLAYWEIVNADMALTASMMAHVCQPGYEGETLAGWVN